MTRAFGSTTTSEAGMAPQTDHDPPRQRRLRHESFAVPAALESR
ncbi:hypothetical protein [Ruania albidiflava]|nr:hypothetical protein [Ruania albidiflava]